MINQFKEYSTWSGFKLTDNVDSELQWPKRPENFRSEDKIKGVLEPDDFENDGSNIKRPVGQAGTVLTRLTRGADRKDDDQEDRATIPPPTSTRASRRSKKGSEMSTDGGLGAPDGGLNEDGEVISTTNTPSSSASSSR